jgi:hypothetical protein
VLVDGAVVGMGRSGEGGGAQRTMAPGHALHRPNARCILRLRRRLRAGGEQGAEPC